ncbi:hypothetical protein Tco_0418159 [Tanacetum coccineum]
MTKIKCTGDLDVDEVFVPVDGIPFPNSSVGGGQPLEDEMLNSYDGYEDQFEEYPSSYQEFCDQFDFKVKDRAGSENRPLMLNKENYVPWSSRLLCYAKSRPNEKLIYNSIMNGPYVRRMIPKLGDPNREVPVPETFHEQTDDELTEDKFTSTDGESIEFYYHRFSKFMNDFKRNKHFPEKIASNLKFLNNLQPEWSRHVTIVHQTKDLHTADYTQLYDFLKYNQNEVDDLRVE